MKTRSILSAAIGSVFFASAIMMLIPTLASATYQNTGSPPRVSQAAPPRASQEIRPIGKNLSAQQMKATKGAGGRICDLDCNNGVNSCGFGHDAAYPNSICVSHYYHFLLCEDYNNPFYSPTCSVNLSRSCYDFDYYSPGFCTGNSQSPGSIQLGTTVHHMVMACGGGA